MAANLNDLNRAKIVLMLKVMYPDAPDDLVERVAEAAILYGIDDFTNPELLSTLAEWYVVIVDVLSPETLNRDGLLNYTHPSIGHILSKDFTQGCELHYEANGQPYLIDRDDEEPIYHRHFNYIPTPGPEDIYLRSKGHLALVIEGSEFTLIRID